MDYGTVAYTVLNKLFYYKIRMRSLKSNSYRIMEWIEPVSSLVAENYKFPVDVHIVRETECHC